MNSIPVRYILFTLFLSATLHVQAQIRTDLIYKLDNTTFNAVVDEIGETEILYFLPKDTARRTTLRIARKEVWKIVYGSGETEVINKPVVAVAAPAAPAATQVSNKPDRLFLKNKTMVTGNVTKVTDQKVEYRRREAGALYEVMKSDLIRVEYGDGHVENFDAKVTEGESPSDPASQQASVAAEKTKSNPLSKISITAGFDGNYFAGSKIWTDKEDGAGLLTSLGGSLRGNYQISKLFGAYLTLGYSQASVQKNYLAGNELMYKEEFSLAGPSAGVGLKYFLKESVYVHAEGKGNFLKMKVSVSEDGESTEDRLSAACPSFGAGIGFTRKIAKVIVEADVHYQMMKSSFESVTKPIHTVGIRLAVGMSMPSNSTKRSK
ncbi:hypothetical protein [Dyadobacter bucti]|uniref:hypothetical protein n=1 Tax=Dyadobacter bucti TaxID=2572203 RepID=UPI00110A0178|nr:hypothetical protein [Dyadobacter bucti]